MAHFAVQYQSAVYLVMLFSALLLTALLNVLLKTSFSHLNRCQFSDSVIFFRPMIKHLPVLLSLAYFVHGGRVPMRSRIWEGCRCTEIQMSSWNVRATVFLLTQESSFKPMSSKDALAFYLSPPILPSRIWVVSLVFPL